MTKPETALAVLLRNNNKKLNIMQVLGYNDK